MQLLIGMSMRRYLAPRGTAGLARSLVNGYSRVPAPPPKMIANTRFTYRPHFKDYCIARPCRGKNICKRVRSSQIQCGAYPGIVQPAQKLIKKTLGRL